MNYTFFSVTPFPLQLLPFDAFLSWNGHLRKHYNLSPDGAILKIVDNVHRVLDILSLILVVDQINDEYSVVRVLLIHIQSYTLQTNIPLSPP